MLYVIVMTYGDGTTSVVGDKHGEPFNDRWAAEAALSSLPEGADVDKGVLAIEGL